MNWSGLRWLRHRLRRGIRRIKPRRKPRCSRLGFALIVSTLLHLSMVTVFKIVIYFPREDIEFYQFELIPDRSVRPAPASGPGAPDRLRLPRLNDMLSLGNGAAAETPFEVGDRMLPEISLPTLEFAELERLQVRQRSVASSPLYQEIFQEERPDSWQRFGQRLRQMGQALSPGRERWDDSTPLSAQLGVGAQPSEQRMPVGRPADGFEAYIEWSSEPQDRSLLYAPPIRALWQVDPAAMERPIEVVFEVNPHGRVISVWSPNVDDSGVLDEVQAALLKYRFGSVEDRYETDQLATLIIRPERPEAPTP